MNVSLQGVTWVLVGMLAGTVAGCGSVGPPIPPENVGVDLTIKEQKKKEKLELLRQRKAAAGEELPDLPVDQLLLLEGQDVDLPPLRPVGTR